MMCEKLSVLVFGLFLVIFVTFAYQVEDPEDSSNYYTAAVVEYTPVYNRGNGPLTLKENADAYIKYIEEASQHGADIIVFPANGLTSTSLPGRKQMDSWTTVIPPAQDEYVPCTMSDVKGVSETLTRLSCAARKNRIYVVVNIAEKNGIYYHNTNVAFDRTGKIVARYRKVNLDGELSFDKPKTPEVVTFDTDFGVKFGTFICFDILFPVPALNLTRTLGVSNIVYTAAWWSEVPFLTAIQTQSGWAYSQNVNLLGAGYHLPEFGGSGSGIYWGRGGLRNATMTSHPKHRLLISRVPKKPHPQTLNADTEGDYTTTTHNYIAASPDAQKTEDYNGINMLHDNLTSFSYVQLNHTQFTQTICQNNLCCDFDISAKGIDSTPVNYRAVVFDGIRRYGHYMDGGVRLCGLIQCANDSITSCGSAKQTNITFTHVTIRGTFGDDYSSTVTFPSVLNPALLPFDHWTFTEKQNGNETNVILSLTQPTSDLVTFGMYNRVFSRDKWYRI
ncbi:vanin-like protein 1 [Ceratina calcarata]|uniref:Vanin-like protein 1 n=1 Tax=Ceratina calcarata TaxID=156304 RepID=A0AAJ7IXZ4_9HYME|nr:vanin-like protein 1 [Ceratina calcarata]XP_017879788.1 vanin-like protein 1 [Ceratina calcarata]